MTFKARKEFPNNSPLQLTLMETRQWFHCTGTSTWPRRSWEVKGLHDHCHSSSWQQCSEAHYLTEFAQGSKFGRELLVYNWNEINFYFQLIRCSRISETSWSLRKAKKSLRKFINLLSFPIRSFRHTFATPKTTCMN